MAFEITGEVRGTVTFPEHPNHEGWMGLQGGEDVTAEREFRSVGEAMTWCRSVLDEQVEPKRVDTNGRLLTPHTDPAWSEARVVRVDPIADLEEDTETQQSWITGEGRGWYEEIGDWRTASEPARVDPPVA